MNLKWLEAFAAIVRHGQISRAADELMIPQSTLSRQLSALERALGTRLLIRGPRGVSFTAAGEALNSRASSLLDMMLELDEALATSKKQRPLVRVGLPPGLPTSWIARKLTGIDALLSLHDAPSNEQLQMLSDGVLDIALTHTRSPSHPSALVLRQALGVAVNPASVLGSRTAAGEPVDVASLAAMTLMAHSQGEVRAQEGVLKSLASAAGVTVKWIFRRFGQHGQVIAEFANADAAMTTHTSASINFPDWKWHALASEMSNTEDLSVSTWANWNPEGGSSTLSTVEKLTT